MASSDFCSDQHLILLIHFKESTPLTLQGFDAEDGKYAGLSGKKVKLISTFTTVYYPASSDYPLRRPIKHVQVHIPGRLLQYVTRIGWVECLSCNNVGYNHCWKPHAQWLWLIAKRTPVRRWIHFSECNKHPEMTLCNGRIWSITSDKSLEKISHAIHESAGSQRAWPEEVSYVHALNSHKNVEVYVSLKSLHHMAPLSIFHWNEWGGI